jgi:hypothetical protein
MMIRRMKWHHTRTIDGVGGHHAYIEPTLYVDVASASDVEVAYAFDAATGDDAARLLDAWRARYSRHDGDRPWSFGSWAWHIHLSAYPHDEAAEQQAAEQGMIAVGRMGRDAYQLHFPLLYQPITTTTDADIAMAWHRCPAQRTQLEAEWRRRHAADEGLRGWARAIHEAAHGLVEVAS